MFVCFFFFSETVFLKKSSGEGGKKGPSRKPSTRSLRKKGADGAKSPRGERPADARPIPKSPRGETTKVAAPTAPPKTEPVAKPPSSKANDDDDDGEDDENPNFNTVVEKPTISVPPPEDEENANFSTVVSRDQVEEEDGFSTTVVRPSEKQMQNAPARSPRRVSPEKQDKPRRSVRVARGAVPGKASEFGNKLKNIYREELVTKLPFLTLDYLEPLCMVSTDKRVNNFRYAMSEVASTQPAAAMLEGAQINAIVGNLLKTHQARTKESKSVPMSPEEEKDHESMVCDISDVLKVLLL